MRLFLFPYAGGGPASFWKWSGGFPNLIEIWIAHYPGRGSRYNEAPAKKMSGLVEEISRAIPPFLDKPFAFFGHSLGGLVAFELTHFFRQKGMPQPIILFISACDALQLPDPHPAFQRLPDPEFVKALQELNGIPEEFANQPEFLETLLPTLRADFEVAESYQYDPSKQPLGCPIIAFGGSDDLHISREQMEGWASHTNSRFESIYFPGDHFYLNSAKDKIVQSITQKMMQLRSANHKSG